MAVFVPTQAHALDDIITPGALLAVSNLSYRGYTHQLPMATASDSCSFSQNPKEAHLRHALQELRNNLPVSGAFLKLVSLVTQPDVLLTCSSARETF